MVVHDQRNEIKSQVNALINQMLQVADLVCTAALTELKMQNKTLSKSERKVLGTNKEIQKNLLNPLKRKEFKD